MKVHCSPTAHFDPFFLFRCLLFALPTIDFWFPSLMNRFVGLIDWHARLFTECFNAELNIHGGMEPSCVEAHFLIDLRWHLQQGNWSVSRRQTHLFSRFSIISSKALTRLLTTPKALFSPPSRRPQLLCLCFSAIRHGFYCLMSLVWVMAS